MLPDADIHVGFLWQKIYTQLHIALVSVKKINGNSDVAVSFPEYGNKVFPLGAKLRLFASTQEQLQQLDINQRLIRLTDYSHCTSIKSVPEAKQFACFSRKQFKTNIERQARRRMKRTTESFEECVAYLMEKGFEDHQSDLPYINIESSSTQEDQKSKHRFRLFIDRTLLDKSVVSEFNCYGLSKTATVPWF